MTTPTDNLDGPARPLTCRQVLDFVMLYLDRELPPDTHERFEHHLGECPSCVNYLRSYMQTIRLERLAFEHDEDPAHGVMPADLLNAICRARAARPDR